MSKKPTVLMILDGYGLNDKKEGNAVYLAKTPVMDKLMAEAVSYIRNLPESQKKSRTVISLRMKLFLQQ